MSTAVFIDTENLVGGLGKRFREVHLGKALCAVCDASLVQTSDIDHLAVYGPWHLRDKRLSRVRSSIGGPPAELVTTEMTNGKSILDTKLVIDAAVHDTTAGGSDTYVIMSGDSDMIPLVRFLKDRHRRVIGAGRPESAGMIADVCDSFVFLSGTGRFKKNRPDRGPDASGPALALRDAVDEILGKHDEVPASWLANCLAERIRNTARVEPADHYEAVLGVRQFKKVMAKLYPDGQIRLSESGEAVARASSIPAEDVLVSDPSAAPSFRGPVLPAFRGSSLPDFRGTMERDEVELGQGADTDVPVWDSDRMTVIELPEISSSGGSRL